MGETISNVGVIGVDWAYHPNELLSVHAKAARKLEHIDGLSPSTTSLAQVGAEVALAYRLSIEGYRPALYDDTGAWVLGYAVELVYALSENVGISMGYSTLGLDDPDLRLVAPWPEGVYYRVRVKF